MDFSDGSMYVIGYTFNLVDIIKYIDITMHSMQDVDVDISMYKLT